MISTQQYALFKELIDFEKDCENHIQELKNKILHEYNLSVGKSYTVGKESVYLDRRNYLKGEGVTIEDVIIDDLIVYVKIWGERGSILINAEKFKELFGIE